MQGLRASWARRWDRGEAPTLLVLVLLYGMALGVAPLFDVDEGAFAEASRHMLASGDWLHTMLLGEDRFDKPILVYWLQAASLAVFGVNEFAVRLPSAVAVVLACAYFGRLAAARLGDQVGWRAAFILGTCPGLLLIGRASTADGLLNALLIATALCLMGFIETGRTGPLRWAYLWCSLGLLTKGPVAVLVPGAALVIWSLTTDRLQTAWAAVRHLWGWLILLAVAAPWYAYAYWRHGQAFLDGFILRHNVERFTGTLEGHGGSWGYYAVLLPLMVLPWTPLLLKVLASARWRWSEPLHRFLLVWVGFVFVFFSLSGTKLPHYILYCLPPLCLLMAIESTRVGAWGRLGMGLCAAAFLLPVAAIPLGADTMGHRIGDRWIRQLVQTAPAFGQVLTAAAMAAAVLILVHLRRSHDHWSRWSVSVAAVALAWVVVLVPWVGQALQGPFKDMAQWSREQQLRTVLWRMHQPSVAFYRAEVVPKRPPSPDEAALVRIDRLEHLPMGHTCVIREHRGLMWVVDPDGAEESPACLAGGFSQVEGTGR